MTTEKGDVWVEIINADVAGLAIGFACRLRINNREIATDVNTYLGKVSLCIRHLLAFHRSSYVRLGSL